MATETSSRKDLPLEMLEKIIHFSDLDSIKNFRLVCRACSIVALPMLRKFSKVSLSPGIPNKMISNFNATFANLELENLPFDSVKITCEDRSFTWETLELDEFFDRWGHTIKYLEFYKAQINIPRITGEKNAYQLSPAVQCNLTTLILDCTWPPMIEISIDHLMGIKSIKLIGLVSLRKGTQPNVLTPSEIDLNRITYWHSDGTRFRPQVPLSEFVDFSLARKVTIHANRFVQRPRVSLDMTTKKTVDNLTLSKVGIKFASTNKWIVKGLLCLSKIPWVDSNEMKFTSLDFEDEIIDISKLPQTIEYLRLTNSKYISPEFHCLEVEQSDTATTLPNLKFLSTNLHWFFPRGFRYCEKLTDLDLSGCCVPDEDDIRYEFEADETLRNGVEFEQLPCNVQKMKIHPRGVFYSLVEDRPRLEIDTLIVDGWLMPSSLKETPRKIKPQKLVLMLDDMNPNLEEWEELLSDINENKNSMVIYLGPVELTDVYRFSNYVDTSTIDYQQSSSSYPEEYWFKFDTNFGKPVSKSEFDQISTLSQGNLPVVSKCRI